MSKFILVIFTFLNLVSNVLGAETGTTVNEIMEMPKKEGQDILLKDPQISSLYQKGEFLVYDCINQHWVCTASPEFKRCANDRKEALAENEERLPCANVKTFKNHETCIKSQAKLTNSNMENRFCIHPIYRKMEFNY